MARRARVCPAGWPQHVIQRGNNRQFCFVDNVDRSTYRIYLNKYRRKYEVEIHAWVFMSNHIHLLVTPKTDQSLSAFMKAVGQHYAQYFNSRHERTGGLWEGRFKSCIVDTESYFLQCQRYIELNPVKAGMVTYAGDYPWSSYRCHAHGEVAAMHTPHPCYLEYHRDPAKRLQSYRHFVASYMPENIQDQIRHAIQSGTALGSEVFQQQVQSRFG